MSHAATNWAIAQRGLKPLTKLLLWHLADAHNPALGCFPSQARLASELEVSRSTVNVHLDLLESGGLIARVQEVDRATNKQMPTRYFLAFEPEFDRVGQEKSRVRNPDTENPLSIGETNESRVWIPDTGAVSDFLQSRVRKLRNPVSDCADTEPVSRTCNKPVRRPQSVAAAPDGASTPCAGAGVEGLSPNAGADPIGEEIRRCDAKRLKTREAFMLCESASRALGLSRHEFWSQAGGPMAANQLAKRLADGKINLDELRADLAAKKKGAFEKGRDGTTDLADPHRLVAQAIARCGSAIAQGLPASATTEMSRQWAAA